MEPNTKERPILFSAPMVRAILAGTKTQTRRIVKPQPQPNGGAGLHPVRPYRTPAGDWNWVLSATGMGCGNPFPCPYGQPGDRLYVRETWRVGARWDDSKPSDIPPNSCTVLYKAGGFTTNGDAGERIHGGECSNPEWAGKTRTAIHMPRWASRIDLEITGVRVEQLNAISEADAVAEGCVIECMRPDGSDNGTAIWNPGGYVALWESINGAGSWDANPWVWVVSFQRVDQRSKV